MNNLTRSILDALAITLIGSVYVYTGMYKTFNFELWRSKVNAIDFVKDFNASWIAYIIPCLEIIIPVCLIFDKAKIFGIISSFILTSIFTIYVIYLFQTQGEVPCPCGGIFSELSIKQHLLVNAALLLSSGVLWIFRRRISLAQPA